MKHEKEINTAAAMTVTGLSRSKFDVAIDDADNYLPRRYVGGSTGRLFRPSDIERWIERAYELERQRTMKRRGITQTHTGEGE